MALFDGLQARIDESTQCQGCSYWVRSRHREGEGVCTHLREPKLYRREDEVCDWWWANTRTHTLTVEEWRYFYERQEPMGRDR